MRIIKLSLVFLLLSSFTTFSQVTKNSSTFVVTAACFSSDGEYIITGSADGKVKLWEMQSGMVVKTFGGSSDKITAIAVSPDRKYVLTGSESAEVQLFETETGKKVQSFYVQQTSTFTEIPKSKITYLNFSSDNKEITILAKSGQLVICSTKRMKLLKLSDTYLANIYSITPDFEYSIGFIEKEIFIQRTSGTLKERDRFYNEKYHAHSGEVTSVAISPNGEYLVSGGTDRTVKLWKIETLKKREGIRNDRKIFDYGFDPLTLEGHLMGITCVSFSPDGKYILSGSEDETMILWDTETRTEVKTYYLNEILNDPLVRGQKEVEFEEQYRNQLMLKEYMKLRENIFEFSFDQASTSVESFRLKYPESNMSDLDSCLIKLKSIDEEYHEFINKKDKLSFYEVENFIEGFRIKYPRSPYLNKKKCYAILSAKSEKESERRLVGRIDFVGLLEEEGNLLTDLFPGQERIVSDGTVVEVFFTEDVNGKRRKFYTTVYDGVQMGILKKFSNKVTIPNHHLANTLVVTGVMIVGLDYPKSSPK